MSDVLTPRRLKLADLAALVVGLRSAVHVTGDGEIKDLDLAQAVEAVGSGNVLVVHAPATARRLGLKSLFAFDLLELFAFVEPARFCLPTPVGLATALDLPRPSDLTEAATLLPEIACQLLARLEKTPNRPQAVQIAAHLDRGHWPWAPLVSGALGEGDRGTGFDIWNQLPEWEEGPPAEPPIGLAVHGHEARMALERLLSRARAEERAEERPSQADYAALAAEAFGPRQEEGSPALVLAEAGTGIGKTAGYIAPAGVWAAKNRAPVWISTYTKNLQRQIDRELDCLFPDPVEKVRRTVIRKGRENYLCLLNFEEVVRTATGEAGSGWHARADLVALGLIARWGGVSRDGDMIGGDFPTWASEIIGQVRVRELVDRRGECIHSACPHYRRCFIERSRVKAKGADIVVANHALVMVQAVRATDGRDLPTRYVFDEGHHLFEAADGAFGARFSGLEASEMRRWLRGHETGHRREGRGRGLERRIGDLVAGDEAAERAMTELTRAAAGLPGEGWAERVAAGETVGPVERFLSELRRFVAARAVDQGAGSHTIEALIVDPPDGLLAAGREVDKALGRLIDPTVALRARLVTRLDEGAEDLDTPTRLRLDAVVRSLESRVALVLTAWRDMVRWLGDVTPEDFFDWAALDRIEGGLTDVGLHRRWLDPTKPLAARLYAHAHGVLVTSATLRDGAMGADADWQMAEVRTGAAHLVLPARRAFFPSPFDYAADARVLLVTDVRRDRDSDVAAAYRALFLASGGAALGLFTAIERLRRVHARLVGPLDDAGIGLYAQHVDAMDIGTLIDIFRAETRSCLLGTDAVRDGVDVPGDSLRLIVFDRVPWPRRSLLHRARREIFGGQDYDDMLIRLKLRQAFGRLIRRQGDRGVFVMLDAMMPSRLRPAFPETVPIVRVGLSEAVRMTGAFLQGT